jgi:hypothetical protein
VFEEVGVTLTESQKNSLDTFMLDFQTKLDETRDNAIKATKKLVEEKMEKEFKEVFESITAHQKEVFEKSSKLDLIKSQKLMTEAVDKYLTDYVKEILPKKSIVDYGRMQKLEQIHESLKGMLLVNDDAVEKKVEEVKGELETKMANESKELKDKLEKCEKVIEESKKQNEELEKKYDSLAKKDLINEKTKNLPIVESKRVKEKLSKMTVKDIEKNYKTVLESVQEELQGEQDKIQEEKNLEEAINDIMQEKQGEGDAPEKTGEGEGNGTESNPPEQNSEGDSNSTTVEEEEETPVTESMARAYMQQWIDTLDHLTPKN